MPAYQKRGGKSCDPNHLNDLSKSYDPKSVELRRYAEWLAAGVFHEDPDPARPPFIISMPPPNITGRAHLGHGSTYTPMDILTRYHRMLGENADWIPGQDHAAIATEAVVVRELAKEGITREALGREKFVARVWKWREQYGGAINDAFKALGFGPDWERERFTLDPGLSGAVMKTFVQLYREGLIYRGTRLINWDPESQSTLSDAEVEDKEHDGYLWTIRYPGEDKTFSIEVATTRPETMLGDTAVAVHPDDARYKKLVGKQVILPMVGRRLPIITDEAVEREFGTGAVKVTPAHDQLDNEIGERHNLPMSSVIGFDGKMTAEAPESYRGLDRFEAREAVLRDLKELGLLVKTEPRRHILPISSRSGAIVEPLLSLQWFCKMESLARPALEAYRDGRIRFIPERFGRTYEAWLENIKDWNVSRQIWWGHQLPVWYGPNGETIIAETEEEAYALAQREHGLGKDEIRRDPDTLDTWFSSGLWPFSILGWPEKTKELEHWYPNQVMITGRDIIFLWVARMVMLGMKFAGDIPFSTVFIAPLVFDMQGRVMSKSLGNIIDPMDLIEKYGADALRFGIVQQMRLESQELNFDERFCQKAREFNNKMWNALRYLKSLPEGLPPAGALPKLNELGLADKWILTELRRTVSEVTRALDEFRFGVASDLLLDFTWYRYCDWYLEATKASSPSRAAILSYTLNTVMRLLHPIAPFVSEEIWQALPHDGATILTASWPDPAEIPFDETAAARYRRLMDVVTRARDMRAQLGLVPREKLNLDIPRALDEEVRMLLTLHANATLSESKGADAAANGDPLSAVTVRAPLALLHERYYKELERLDGEVERLEKKLANAQFVSKASPEVVAKEREKLAGYENERAHVRAQLAASEAEEAR